MSPKKLLLFSLSLLLLTSASAIAQQASSSSSSSSSATPAAAPPTAATAPVPPTAPAPPSAPTAPAAPRAAVASAVSPQAAATAPAAPQAATAPAAPRAPRAPVAVYAQGGDNYLGIFGEDVTRENMGRYNLREPRGVVVSRVADGSPAARAGLKSGDVILRFDGEQVSNYRKLQRLINEAAPDQTVRLTISRNGSEQEVSITVSRRPSGGIGFNSVWTPEQSQELMRGMEDAQRAYGSAFGTGFSFGWGRRIGVSTTPLTRQLADYFGIAGGSGLLVTSVTESSPAARAGLKAGDVITTVDGEKVESSGDLSRALNRKAEGDVSITIVRDRNPRQLTVTPEKRDPSSMIISPEAIQIEPGDIEIVMPIIDINLPAIKIKPLNVKPISIKPINIKPINIKPVTIPRVTLPRIRIKPEMLLKEPLMML